MVLDQLQDPTSNKGLPKDWIFMQNHPMDLIIGDPSTGISTRSSLKNEPKTFLEVEN